MTQLTSKQVHDFLHEHKQWLQHKTGTKPMLQHCTIKDIHITHDVLPELTWLDCVCINVRIEHTNLENSDFTGTKWDNTTWDTCHVAYTNFSDSQHTDSHWYESNFSNTIWYNSYIEHIQSKANQFNYSIFEGCTWSYTTSAFDNLLKASFHNAEIKNSTLLHPHMKHTNVTTCIIQHTPILNPLFHHIHQLLNTDILHEKEHITIIKHEPLHKQPYHTIHTQYGVFTINEWVQHLQQRANQMNYVIPQLEHDINNVITYVKATMIY